MAIAKNPTLRRVQELERTVKMLNATVIRQANTVTRLVDENEFLNTELELAKRE